MRCRGRHWIALARSLVCDRVDKFQIYLQALELFHRSLARWRKYFSQPLNVHGVNDFRQTEIHTAGPLGPESSTFEVEMAICKLKGHKSTGIDQISAELINLLATDFFFQILAHPVFKM